MSVDLWAAQWRFLIVTRNTDIIVRVMKPCKTPPYIGKCEVYRGVLISDLNHRFSLKAEAALTSVENLCLDQGPFVQS